MSKDFKTKRKNLELPHKFGAGATYTKFFDGLREGKLFGTECKACGIMYVPGKSMCPKCFAELSEWAEVKQNGTIVSWTQTEKDFYGKPPVEGTYTMALIRLEGTGVDFMHLIGGDLSKLKTGAKVKAVWNDEKKGHMLDIKYFELV